jgi:hypothetical protein
LSHLQLGPAGWNVTFTQTFVMLESAVYSGSFMEVRENILGGYTQGYSDENRVRLTRD